MRKKGFREQIGYTILFLAIILIYSAINGFRDMVGIEQLAPLHCLDYSLGFCSRFLIGSIVKLFIPVLTIRHLDILTLVINLLVDVAIAWLLAYILCKAKKENRLIVGLVIAFALASPYGIYQFMQMRGFLEVYTFIVALLCILCLRRPYLCWAIPFLCFIGLSIHYIFLITFIPLIFSLMLYEIAKQPDKRTIGVFISSFTVSFVSSIYYVFFANRTLNVNYGQMMEYIYKRMPSMELYTEHSQRYTEYIQYYFFSKELDVPGYTVPQNLVEYISFTLKYVKNAIIHNDGKVMRLLFLVLMFLVMAISSIWIINYSRYRQKQAQNIIFRCVYLLNCLLPVAWLSLFILSMDYERFFGIVFCNVFILLLYYIFDENQEVMDTLRFVLQGIRKKPYLSLLAVIGLLTMRIIGG